LKPEPAERIENKGYNLSTRKALNEED